MTWGRLIGERLPEGRQVGKEFLHVRIVLVLAPQASLDLV
jgi:hypothetical protein